MLLLLLLMVVQLNVLLIFGQFHFEDVKFGSLLPVLESIEEIAKVGDPIYNLFRFEHVSKRSVYDGERHCLYVVRSVNERLK